MSEHDQPTTGILPTALFVGAATGTVFGAFDGLVRILGIDPGLFLIRVRHQGLGTALTHDLPSSAELPALFGCALAAIFLYALFTAGLGALVAGAVRFLPGQHDPARFRRHVLLWCSATWLFLELYWWTRPVILPGLGATDPRRLLAAAGLFGFSLLAARWMACRLHRPLKRPAVLLFTLLWLGGAGYYAADRLGSGARRGVVGDRNRDVPNVLLFVVDALRQDVLGCYGHPTVTTPTMDRLAEEGVLFANAFVQVPFTGPSFASFLTGKYPRRHGLLKMVPGYTMPHNLTLPLYVHGAPKAGGGELAEDDFLGGAFLTGTLSHGSGLASGFDYYFEALVGHELVDTHSPWSEFRSGLLPWLYKNKLGQRLDSSLVATTAADWFRRFGDRRFVAMVHYYSTHTPYDPPTAYRELYCDPEYEGPFSAFYAEHRIAIEKGEYEPTEADVRQVRDLYWAGVTQADDMIQQVLDALEEQGVLDETIVVVTSDHGESLGEHGLWEHNWMYQDNLRIPLIMRWPEGLPRGVVVDAITDSIDLFPTLVELMGLEPLRHADSLEEEAPFQERIDSIDGRSLLPLVRGEVERLRAHSFAENGRYRSIQDDRYKLIVRHAQLTEEGWEKMLSTPAAERRGDTETPRLFDLSADPLEMDNLFESDLEAQSVRMRELRAALREWSDGLPIRTDQVIRSDRDLEAEARRMQELGYGDGFSIDEGEGSQ